MSKKISAGLKIKMRKKPYTESGIKRVPCLRCGHPSAQQWQICALGNNWTGICSECDFKLNALVLRFMGLKNINSIMKKYNRNGG